LAQLVELKTGCKLEVLSGGSTVTIPLALRDQIPAEINHLRLGEALFFGADLFTGGLLPELRDDVFELETRIVEVSQKPILPEGTAVENPFGEIKELDESQYGETRWQALVDIGALDVSPETLTPLDSGIEVVGATSDLLVVDLGPYPKRYPVNSRLRFRPNYMGVLHLMQSRYVEKHVTQSDQHAHQEVLSTTPEMAPLPGQNPHVQPAPISSPALPTALPLN
jgi:Predicted amino acid racemase